MITEPETLTDAVRAALREGASIYFQRHPNQPSPSWHERAVRARMEDLRARMFAVLQDLPDDMTIIELREAMGPDGDIAQGRER